MEVTIHGAERRSTVRNKGAQQTKGDACLSTPRHHHARYRDNGASGAARPERCCVRLEARRSGDETSGANHVGE